MAPLPQRYRNANPTLPHSMAEAGPDHVVQAKPRRLPQLLEPIRHLLHDSQRRSRSSPPIQVSEGVLPYSKSISVPRKCHA